MLQNARVTALSLFELIRENQLGGGRIYTSPPATRPRLGFNSFPSLASDLYVPETIEVFDLIDNFNRKCFKDVIALVTIVCLFLILKSLEQTWQHHHTYAIRFL